MDFPQDNPEQYETFLHDTKVMSQKLLFAVRKIVNEEKNGLVCVHALAWMHTILLNECLGEDAQTRLDTVDFTYEKMKNLMTLLIEREKSERHSP